jgi:Ca2+:H+ antiporter
MQADRERLFFRPRDAEPACLAPDHAKGSDEVATGTSMTTPRTQRLISRLRTEWQLPVSIATTALFLVFGNGWLADLSNPAWFAFLLGWLFAAILVSAFAVVRHAEALAVRLGEPFGTLVLTLSMSGMEMMMIAAVMYTGQGGSSLARDTMLAIVMIVLNGLVGTSLLFGGLRYHEQTYNLYGANAFLAVILPLSVLGLVLPRFTVSSPGPTLSPLQSVFLICMSVALYGVFLAIQTMRHRDYFVSPPAAPATTDHPGADLHGGLLVQSVGYHSLLLLAYVVPIVVLAKRIAVPIDYGIRVLGAPAALGGLLVAVLILSPESLAAVRAALANQLQRSINLSLGTALSSISLTIPAVLTIGFITERTIVLGLDAVDTILLLLTLAVSMLTFALERTNVLLGAVHLLLFLAYLALIFEK